MLQLTLLLIIPRAYSALIAQEIRPACQQRQQDGRSRVRRPREIKRKGAQRGQPHQQQKAEAQPQPDAVERAVARQQAADDHHAAEEIVGKVNDGDHGIPPNKNR